MSHPDTSSATSPPHEIIIIPPPGHEGRQMLLDQCINVRTDVFVHEQLFSLDLEVDEYVIFLPNYISPSASVYIFHHIIDH